MKLCHAMDRTNLIHRVDLTAHQPVTCCGWRVRHLLPHLSVECWGNPDMEWCPDCRPKPPRRVFDKPTFTPELVAAIIEFSQDHSLAEASERFNVHQQTITRVRKQAGFVRRKAISDEERQAIFEFRHIKKHSLKETSAKFGRTGPQVSTICSEMRKKIKNGVT